MPTAVKIRRQAILRVLGVLLLPMGFSGDELMECRRLGMERFRVRNDEWTAL
jgi:hypothetical protein